MKANKKLIRENFRNAVFKRDGYKCVLCGDSTSKLDAHHIENRNGFINGGYVLENGITLCDKPDGCHIKVEEFYFDDEKYNDESNPLHPTQLYKLINSSVLKAEEADKKLKS